MDLDGINKKGKSGFSGHTFPLFSHGLCAIGFLHINIRLCAIIPGIYCYRELNS